MKRARFLPRTSVRLARLVSLVLVPATMGCGTMTRVSMLTPVEYEPVVADSVEVFSASGDIRGPYQEIAVITAVPTSSADAMIDTGDEAAIIQALREKAGELGADAIIMRDISPRPDKPGFLRGWAVAIRTGVAPQELGQVPEPAAVTPPWAPPPTRVTKKQGSLEEWLAGGSLVKPVLIGLAGGAAVGALFGALASQGGDTSPPTCREPEAQCILVGAAIGGGLGAVAGVVWGVISKRKARSNRLRVSVAPQRDGRFGLGLSVRF